jgi:chromosome partitioning protein
MISVLVANIKGGCGKTTIATNLAAAFAAAGHQTWLADADRQRSALDWLERRPAHLPAIKGLDWVKRIGAAPEGEGRLVIDAPAALKGDNIEELVREADVIVLPVLPGAFDEHATGRFLSRIEELKPIRKSRKPVAVVGNRLRPRTRASVRLDQFLAGIGHTVVARLRDSALFAEAAADGLSLFDWKNSRAADQRRDFDPLITFIEKRD